MIRSRSLLGRLGEQCGPYDPKVLISLMRVEMMLRNEKRTEECREQTAAREIGRTIWTLRSKGFDFLMRAEI